MSKTEQASSETITADPETMEAKSETIESSGETTPPAEATATLDLQAMAAQHPVDEADDPDIETEFRTRHLDRAMTDEERMKIGQEMADALAEAEHLEARKKELDSDLKTSIDYQYEKAGKLAQALRKGTRDGNVEVKVTKNWHNGSITVTRPDTGETLEERPMTFDERQRSLLDGSQTTGAVGSGSTDDDDPEHSHNPDNPDNPESESVTTPLNPAEAVALTAGKTGR